MNAFLFIVTALASLLSSTLFAAEARPASPDLEADRTQIAQNIAEMNQQISQYEKQITLLSAQAQSKRKAVVKLMSQLELMHPIAPKVEHYRNRMGDQTNITEFYRTPQVLPLVKQLQQQGASHIHVQNGKKNLLYKIFSRNSFYGEEVAFNLTPTESEQMKALAEMATLKLQNVEILGQKIEEATLTGYGPKKSE
jgi:hypothetical protein